MKIHFLEIFEFLFRGQIIKYSYTLIKEKQSGLRYDNVPHHKTVQTYPHHKHLGDKIESLGKPQLSNFIKEVKKLLY